MLAMAREANFNFHVAHHLFLEQCAVIFDVSSISLAGTWAFWKNTIWYIMLQEKEGQSYFSDVFYSMD
jgi:hypothetical protein